MELSQTLSPCKLLNLDESLSKKEKKKEKKKK